MMKEFEFKMSILKWFTTDLTTAKKTLIGTIGFCIVSICYVNWKKFDDRDTMKVAVALDKERLRARAEGRHLSLEDQRRRIEEEKNK